MNGSRRNTTYLPWFGDGADGDLVVSSGTTTVTTAKQYRNVTIAAGATLQMGNDNSHNWPSLQVCGTLINEGTIRAGTVYDDSQAPSRKTTAGAGNTLGTNVERYYIGPAAGRCGGGGAGGGDGTNAGGGAVRSRIGAFHASFATTNTAFADNSPSGTTGAGSNGASASTLATFSADYFTTPRIPGMKGTGAGGGALKVAGGTNYGGAGGKGGRGGGVLEIRAYKIVNSGTIHADGDAGAVGEDGEASNASGDISGGGGGGGGAGGGTVCILYRTLANSGTIRAAGGAGGTGGAGREHNGTPNVARASSNGGNGAAGTAGIVSLTRLG